MNGRMICSVGVVGCRAGTLSLWSLPLLENDFFGVADGMGITFHLFHKRAARESTPLPAVYRVTRLSKYF